MKRFLLHLTVILFVFVFVGCTDPQKHPQEQMLHPSATFSAADFDFSAVKLIRLRSGMSGGIADVTDTEEIQAIIDSVRALHGSDPISSRGYYGFAYHFEFYDTDSPTDTTTPLFASGIIVGSQCAYVTHGVYEVVGSFTYSAMYKTTFSNVEPTIQLCDGYFQ